MRYGNLLVMLLWLSHHFATAQPTMSLARLQQNIEKAKQQVSTCKYKVWVERKDMAKPDWKSRYFTVYLRQNPNNYYGFDWEISEYKQGYEYLITYQDTILAEVSKQFYLIGERVEKYGCEWGDYAETMRQWCLPDEWLHSLLYHQPDTTQIQIIAPNPPDTCWQIQITLNANQTKTLWIDTTTCFITQIQAVYTDSTVSASTIERFHYTHFQPTLTLPDSVLNTHYYKQTGLYKYKGSTPSSSTSNLAPSALPAKETFTPTLINTLFTQPMLLPNNDTVYLYQQNANLFVLDFWYLNCPPCRKAMPALQNLHEKYSPKGVKVIGINGIDFNNKDYVAHILMQSGFTYPLYFATRTFLQRELVIPAYPTLAIFNKNRQLLHLETGYDPATNYTKLVEEMLRQGKHRRNK